LEPIRWLVPRREDIPSNWIADPALHGGRGQRQTFHTDQIIEMQAGLDHLVSQVARSMGVAHEAHSAPTAGRRELPGAFDLGQQAVDRRRCESHGRLAARLPQRE
jgi:hypothetical protein